MLLYYKDALLNLTLDHFERGLISERFGSIVQRINIHKTRSSGGLAETGSGMETWYSFDDAQDVQVLLFLSDTIGVYRNYYYKEKIFSSHINIFQPCGTYGDTYERRQRIRPYLKYKRMKLLLGKIRILHFKKYIKFEEE